ncbi:hypothetical protein ACFY4C_06300 [Actinomadura viridis]|uniref:hypothetical protein n=1 Tax=Actinomadura viridis TaxID=58110 RepID=UPI0036B78199
MAVSIFRRRGDAAHADGTTQRPRRAWPVRRTAAGEAPGRTVVERRPSRWRRSRHNPISAMILAAGWAAAVILGLGMLLTWGDANPGNALVDATLDTGRWLATPFHDAFPRPNPEHGLYLNWSIAAAVYYLMGRVLSWLTRF